MSEANRDATDVQLLQELLREGRTLIEEAMEHHIYDESNGQRPEPDCAYVKFVQRVNQLLPKPGAPESLPITAPAAGEGEGEDEDTTWWTNHYRCPRCRHEWTDQHDSQVDDDCGTCGLRHISPYFSDDGSGNEQDREAALRRADEELAKEKTAARVHRVKLIDALNASSKVVFDGYVLDEAGERSWALTEPGKVLVRIEDFQELGKRHLFRDDAEIEIDEEGCATLRDEEGRSCSFWFYQQMPLHPSAVTAT